jgi:hypothetical protein
MNDKRVLATIELSRMISEIADNYGGGPLVQSLLNHLKKHGEAMVELEKENIRDAFDAGVALGVNTYKQPIIPGGRYLNNTYELD